MSGRWFGVFLEMVVPGDPVPKARPRHGAGGHTFTPKRTRDAEAVIRDAAIMALDTAAPLDVPVGVAVEFYCATRRRSDGDNMLKLVTDAMNKVVYTDDYLIEEYFARVHRGVGKDAARTVISVWTMDRSPEADRAQVEAAPGLDARLRALAGEAASLADQTDRVVALVEEQLPFQQEPAAAGD